MERGLIWLPLLAAFIWLARAGWVEYQKIEAYRRWALQFDRSKYDIYSVLGQNGSDLTWGKPTVKEPVSLQTFSLKNVKNILLMVDDKSVDLDNPPDRGRNIALEFLLADSDRFVRIPFTEIPLAVDWGKHLQQELK